MSKKVDTGRFRGSRDFPGPHFIDPRRERGYWEGKGRKFPPLNIDYARVEARIVSAQVPGGMAFLAKMDAADPKLYKLFCTILPKGLPGEDWAVKHIASKMGVEPSEVREALEAYRNFDPYGWKDL